MIFFNANYIIKIKKNLYWLRKKIILITLISSIEKCNGKNIFPSPKMAFVLYKLFIRSSI